MAAEGNEPAFQTSPFDRFRRLIQQVLQTDPRTRRCAVCCGHSICLRCGGRGQVLIVPRGWQMKPYIEDCPDCEGSGACVECGAASLN